MKLKLMNMDISTGNMLVAILNKIDADKFDLRKGDRIMITSGKKFHVAVVDITHSKKFIQPGYIGAFAELSERLNVPNGRTVNIRYENKPDSVAFIKRKLAGLPLKKKEIYEIVQDIVDDKLTDIELTYFVSSTYIHELSIEETVNLTKAIIETGNTLKIKKKVIVDKHCIGGVAGNRTTMVGVPILAAAGLTVPKTSSRSITSPAGTADTMEVLCNVTFDLNKLEKMIKKVGAFMVWGGAVNLAPADDKIIRVEHPVSLDPVGQLLASILAKKKSVGTTHLLIDIPVGKGAKISKMPNAKMLKERFEIIGKSLGFKIDVVITDGKQPIGNGIGPALEAVDVLKVLMNKEDAPKDLRKKTLMLCGRIMELSGVAKKGNGFMIAEDLLTSGKAYAKMVEIIKAQGGSIFKPEQIKLGKYIFDVKSSYTGRVKEIIGHHISRIAKVAGAPGDKGAGLFLNVHLGDKVQEGDILYTIYTESREKMDYAKRAAGMLNEIKIG